MVFEHKFEEFIVSIRKGGEREGKEIDIDINAEVVTFEAIGLPAIQQRVYQPRNKTLKIFYSLYL